MLSHMLLSLTARNAHCNSCLKLISHLYSLSRYAVTHAAVAAGKKLLFKVYYIVSILSLIEFWVYFVCRYAVTHAVVADGKKLLFKVYDIDSILALIELRQFRYVYPWMLSHMLLSLTAITFHLQFMILISHLHSLSPEYILLSRYAVTHAAVADS